MISSDNGLNLNFAHLEASGSIILQKMTSLYIINVSPILDKAWTRTKGEKKTIQYIILGLSFFGRLTWNLQRGEFSVLSMISVWCLPKKRYPYNLSCRFEKNEVCNNQNGK